jgi:hypothetical protein
MIFPLALVHIRKVKVLKTPKFDRMPPPSPLSLSLFFFLLLIVCEAYKLMEIHSDSSEEKGQKVEAAPEATETTA